MTPHCPLLPAAMLLQLFYRIRQQRRLALAALFPFLQWCAPCMNPGGIPSCCPTCHPEESSLLEYHAHTYIHLNARVSVDRVPATRSPCPQPLRCPQDQARQTAQQTSPPSCLRHSLCSHRCSQRRVEFQQEHWPGVQAIVRSRLARPVPALPSQPPPAPTAHVVVLQRWQCCQAGLLEQKPGRHRRLQWAFERIQRLPPL
mmetsp:Transcript_15852/g.35516  ORF Transcript_15852/g.35516 Transcript_15852/m.35516 type:complete len:201 (+) Transcript_15852:70-672(+)